MALHRCNSLHIKTVEGSQQAAAQVAEVLILQEVRLALIPLIELIEVVIEMVVDFYHLVGRLRPLLMLVP